MKIRWNPSWDKRLNIAVWVKVLSKAARTGITLDFAPNMDDEALMASFAAGQPPSFYIPAEALRKVLLDTENHADPRGFTLRGVHIDGRLELRYATLSYPFSLVCCSIPDGVDLSNARIYDFGLSGSSCGVIELTKTRVEGSVYGQNITTKVGMRAPGAQITNQLVLSEAKLINPDGPALFLTSAEVGGGIIAERLTAEGGIDAWGARITGQLMLTEAKLLNPNGSALALDTAEISGGISAEKLTAEGEVRAPGSKINGQIILQEATLTNPNDFALTLNEAEINGGILAEKFTAKGEVRAPGSRINGQLLFLNAVLMNPNGLALYLDRAEITGGLALKNFVAEGEVRAPASRITGQLVIWESSLSNTNNIALNLASAFIDSLFMKENTHIDGNVILRGTHIESFNTGKHFPPPSSRGTLDAVGWVLGDIDGWLRNDPKAAEQWLLLSSETNQFSPQPWHELANVYDRIGHTTAARQLRYNATAQTNKRQPWWVRINQFFYKTLVGYGYHPLRTFWWFTGAFVIALILVSANMNSFAPTNPVAARSAYVATHGASTIESLPITITGATPCEDFGNRYSCLRPWSYAAVTVTPASALQTPAWAPSASWLEAALMALKFSGWILTAFLLAGLTGLLRKA